MSALLALAGDPSPVEADFRRHLRSAMAWPVVAFVVAAGALIAVALYLQDLNRLIDRADVTILRATLVERAIVDAQSRFRSYLLTGEERTAGSFHDAAEEAARTIDRLEDLVGHHPAQSAHLRAVHEGFVRYRAFADGQVSLKRGGAPTSELIPRLNEGANLMNDIRPRLHAIVKAEETFRADRVARAAGFTRYVFIAGMGLALVFGPALALSSARRMRRIRRRYEEALEAQERGARSLRESEEMLRLAKDAAKMGAWHWDLVSGRLAWSNRCKALFGLGPETAMSHDVFLAAIHPEDRSRIDRAMQAALSSRVPYDVEMRVPLRDGSVRWIASKGEASYGADGRAVRMAGMALDITERKLAEARAMSLARFPDENPDPVMRLGPDLAVEYANAASRSALSEIHLEVGRPAPQELAAAAGRAVRDATRVQAEVTCGSRTFAMTFAAVGTEVNVYGQDISERKRAEEALRDADRRKDEFLAMLSHELRNPLAPISGSVRVLEHADPSGEPARRARTIIARQVDHLARLVDDLLDVRRISSGKLRLHMRPMDLTAQVRETVEDLRPLLVHRDLSLDMAAPRRPVWVNGDRTRLAQVVGNLLQNAAKFTNAGGHVSVTVESGDGEARIRVADDGIGIEPAMLGKVFETFVQADTSLDRTRGGLGLGLSLVRGIAGLHGGTAVARSGGAGRGAEFVVTLPTTEPAVAPFEATAAPIRGEKRRVLIIEDNRDAADSLRQLLELLGGHEVILANDGPEGIAAARAHAPDVILCDLGLPVMDGYEVARRLRAAGIAPGARLVALSGYAAAEHVERALRAGFDYHVSKPPDFDRLLAIVAGALGPAPPSNLPSELATGHHEVDRQHASFLAQLARLRAVSPDMASEALRLLCREAVSHFRYEETLMEDVGNPELTAHRGQHAEFLHQLHVLLEELERGEATAECVARVVYEIDAWLAAHTRLDRRLAEFIRREPGDHGDLARV